MLRQRYESLFEALRYTKSSQTSLLDQLARMRAALFNYCPPSEFAAQYLHSRIFDFKPDAFTLPVAPTREFWIHVMESKVEATIKNEGDMIGWEDDEEIVEPVALAAKQSLLKAIPHLLPLENSNIFYRLVLEHGDFGIHNTSIAEDDGGKPLVTSLYDWETACVVPSLLADPMVAVSPVDLTADERAEPVFTRIPPSPEVAEMEVFAAWSQYDIKVGQHRSALGIFSADLGYHSNCTRMRQTSRPLSKQDGTYGICGLRCATGVVVHLKSSLATLELGRRHG